MLVQLAILLLIFALIADVVILREKNKTNTPDSDKTYLGFKLSICIPKYGAWVLLAYDQEGFVRYVAIFGILLVTISFISYLIPYLAARKEAKNGSKTHL